ncbi:hypothetical protein EJ997_04850 [Flaviflexus ciconiae]|uniref:O-antigen ligase domain-containing protein n=1 Tax=Flaviflexus ciconiae TaxID=2496867 RepID=A0A3S9PWV2_9ACTO|nr:hypothetical protein [Flaviflexus ciconiae]AZQ76772.1 hypothetical protein EJ997_04850 [Flaviflexus ciconiae]
MLPFVALTATLFLLDRRSRPNVRILALVVLALVLWTITISNYTIAFSLTLVSVLLLIGAKRPSALVFILFLASVVIASFSRELGRFISHVAMEGQLTPIVSQRLLDFGQSLQFGLDGMTEGRLRLYQTSWNAFIDNPLLGVEGGGYLSGQSIGQHSSWLDFLGAFGLWVSVPLLLAMALAFRKSWRIFTSPKHRLVLLMSLLLLGIFGLLNPILTNPQVGFGHFFLVPLGLAMNSISRRERAE